MRTPNSQQPPALRPDPAKPYRVSWSIGNRQDFADRAQAEARRDHLNSLSPYMAAAVSDTRTWDRPFKRQ